MLYELHDLMERCYTAYTARPNVDIRVILHD